MIKKSLFIFLGGAVSSISANSVKQLSIPENALISSGLDVTFIAKFALFAALLLLGTIFFGKIFGTLFHLPVISGQIIGGILLGPSFINLKSFNIFSEPLKIVDQITNKLYLLSSSDLFVFVVLLISSAFTVSYLLWIAGHETDIQDILKVGVTATSAGIFGAILPIILTSGFAYHFLGPEFTLARSLGLGIIFAATSVSIPVAVIFSFHKMSLRSSKATLGAAVIDDIVTIIILSVFTICISQGVFGCVASNSVCEHNNSSIFNALVHMALAFVLMFGIGYIFLPPFLLWLNKKKYFHIIAPFASGLMLLYFASAELIGGLSGITGAYFAGLFHHRCDMKHKAERAISPYVTSFLLPLFLGSIGLQIDVTILTIHEWIIVFFFLFIAIISKLFGCYIATFLSNIFSRKGENRWTWLEGYLFGSAMIARGEVGLVVSTILRSAKLITFSQYTIAIVVIILTTIVCPIMLSIGFSKMNLTLSHRSKDKEYTINLGPFKIIGTIQMFNIIVGRIESETGYNTSIYFSEGRKIVNIEALKMKIIYSPNEGIIFKGKKRNIEDILKLVKISVFHELEKIPEI